MRAGETSEIGVMSIEDCQRLDAPLRHDLEVLDYEIRRVVARVRNEARDAGADDMIFVKASTTVLLSIAAGLMARAADDRRAAFDAESFIAGADSAARWAGERRLRLCLAGEG
jgi:hypothetical protein